MSALKEMLKEPMLISAFCCTGLVIGAAVFTWPDIEKVQHPIGTYKNDSAITNNNRDTNSRGADNQMIYDNRTDVFDTAGQKPTTLKGAVVSDPIPN